MDLPARSVAVEAPLELAMVTSDQAVPASYVGPLMTILRERYL